MFTTSWVIFIQSILCHSSSRWSILILSPLLHLHLPSSILICIRLRRTCTALCSLRRVTSSLQQLMCIVYHVTLVEASRNVNLGMRYDSRCVGTKCGMESGGEIKKFLSCDRSTGSCICLLCVSVIFCRQGHIHDPVLLSQDRNYTFVFLITTTDKSHPICTASKTCKWSS